MRTDTLNSIIRWAVTLAIQRTLTSAGQDLVADFGEPMWLDTPGDAPGGYRRYRDDAFSYDFRLPAEAANVETLGAQGTAILATGAYDMVGTRTDGDPSTVARWQQGAWAGYEDSNGTDGGDTGGTDGTIEIAITSQDLGDPFVVEPGTSSAWFDSSRDGEGFMLEILDSERAVMYWFTYNGEGQQDWYLAEGEVRGNRILFPELLQVSGGKFGPGFNPEDISYTAAGSATFIWSSCDSGAMSWVLDRDGQGFRKGLMQLSRLSRVMGLECGLHRMPPKMEAARLSGSWYNPSRSGEGYVLEVMSDRNALVYWFGFDALGNRRWFFGMAPVSGPVLSFPDVMTTTGGVFGAAFDPAGVQLLPWGSLELELGCEDGTARFESVESGFPAGQMELTRLTYLDGLGCDNPPNN